MAPEGSAAAIREAVRAGADMVELDVQMTRDGRLIIFHDDRLERITNGRGRVSGLRYADLARLDAGLWFNPRFAGQRILLVSQAIRLLPPRMRMNLELKRTSRPHGLLQRFVRLIRRARVERRLLVSSFDARLLRAVPAAAHMACALICDRHPDRSLRRAIQLRCVAWHPLHTLLTPHRVTQAHAAGLRVHAWTVDQPGRVRQLLRWGVDGVFTNDPARLRRALRSRMR